MNKNIVQDVIPPKRSIRNVKLPARTSNVATTTTTKKSSPKIQKEPAVSEPLDFSRPVSIKTEVPPVSMDSVSSGKPPIDTSTYKYEYDEPSKPRKNVLYISLVILLVLVGFGVSAFFKSAKITITPKNETSVLDDTFSAKKDSTVGLGYQIVTVTDSVEKNVETTGETKVDLKARGTIVIYNSYSSQPQKLVATTRFQTPEGLVYRLLSPVSVPGSSVVGGKTVAGSIEAIVEADKTGTSYNVGLKDFTVPGLKGDPKYTKIYGRSKTDMTGGFSGMQRTVAKDLLDRASKEMESTLKETLSKSIVSQIPNDFVLYNTSLTFKFESVSQTNNPSGGAILRKKATATAIIFDKGAISRTLLSKVLPNSVDENIKITNLNELDFAYASGTPSDINTANNIAFSLKGSPNFVWVVDENKLKSELLGLSKKEATSVISKHSNIKEAWIETKPFWNQTIPTDPNKVNLINTLTK
jgi:hypothetical protein